MADYKFPGYPTAFGNKKVSAILHLGPAAYPNAASNKAGGETIQASAFGLRFIESVIAHSMSDDGQYFVRPVFSNVSPDPPQPQASFRLQWFDIATAAQMANLSVLNGRYVRLTVVGVG